MHNDAEGSFILLLLVRTTGAGVCYEFESRLLECMYVPQGLHELKRLPVPLGSQQDHRNLWSIQ